VLDGQKDWDEKKIFEAMQPVAAEKAGMPVTVDLERPVPVYLIYLTAFVRDGVLHFRDDPYGKDGRAIARLGGYPLGASAPEDRSECDVLKELAGR
jgi:murein L,D-transpeptidase YcbB/YkuD